MLAGKEAERGRSTRDYETALDSLEARNEDLKRALAEAREAGERWRTCYGSLRELIAHCGTNGDLERLDQIMREWVSKA